MSDLFPLVVSGAVTSRGGKVLVGPVDLQLEASGTTVVIGPNGSGKTSFLRMLHGTARLSEGTVGWACGTQAARQASAFVFQRPILLRRSVVENLVYPLRVKGVPRKEARALAQVWADRVGLSDMLDRAAPVLSGGEQQKLALARALITKPEVLFLDEPCASLDGRSMFEIEETLREAQKGGTRLILSTHDMGQARRLATDVVFLLRGKVLEHAQAAHFFEAPSTPQAQAFLNGDIVE